MSSVVEVGVLAAGVLVGVAVNKREGLGVVFEVATVVGEAVASMLGSGLELGSNNTGLGVGEVFTEEATSFLSLAK